MSKTPEFLRRRSEITGFFVRKIFMSNEIWGKEELLKSPYKSPPKSPMSARSQKLRRTFYNQIHILKSLYLNLYILSGAEKPSTSMQASSTFFVSKSTAIQLACWALSSSEIIFVS